MKRCVIVSAGEIKNYEKMRSFLRNDDFFIFCDGALEHAQSLNVIPEVITGDFDSARPELLEKYKTSAKEIIQLPCEKDDTDTMYAVKYALKKGFTDFLLLGSLGKRFDHAFGNVSALLYLHNHKAHAVLADDFSIMEVAGKSTVYIEDLYSYFSILTPFGNVKKVSIKNAKYPLKNAALKSDFPLGISNEVLKGKTAEVCIKKGAALVVKVF